MVQTVTSESLLDGFKYELETIGKRKTVNYYHGHIKRFFTWAESQGIGDDLRFINKQVILTFFHHLLQSSEIAISGNNSCRLIKRTEQTRWPYYRSLRRFFGWAVREGYLGHNPMDGIILKAPKTPLIEPYRTEHIVRMVEILQYNVEIAKTPRQKMLAARNFAVFLLFLESGLRCQEMANLTLGDIELAKQRLVVRDAKMGKGRIVGFGPRTKKALWRYITLRPQSVVANALWVTEEGRPLRLEGVRQVIRCLKKEAGLEHVKGSVHKLRHTFATSYLRHTKDMKGCRILLGHSTLAMTERYTQAIEAEDALKAYDGQGPLDWLVSSSCTRL